MMNFNDLQSLWNSPDNRPSGTIQQQRADKFVRQMIRRRRFQGLWLINTFVWLTLITAFAVWNIIKKQTAIGQEWALIPLLLLPWFFAVCFLRRYWGKSAPISRGEVSIVDSYSAALSSNRTEQSDLKRVGVLFALMIPVLSMSLWQLHAVGKTSARELASMAIFFGAVLLLSGAGIAARYFGSVLPQEKQLKSLLAELGEP